MYKVKEIIGDILLTMFLEGQFNAFMLEHVKYNGKKKLGVIIEQEGNKYCRLELEEDMEFHISELRKIVEMAMQNAQEVKNNG